MLRIYLVQPMKPQVKDKKEQTRDKRHVVMSTQIPAKNSTQVVRPKSQIKTVKTSKIFKTSLRNRLSNSISRISSIRLAKEIEVRYNAMEGLLVTTLNQSVAHFILRDRINDFSHQAKRKYI